MCRAIRFGSVAALAGLLAALVSASAHAAGGQPNVLVLYLDDMGWAQPGCYGGKLAPTPHIDSLAAEGVRFTEGYVSACVCSPSRVGLVTGRYQARTGHDANTTEQGPGRELLLSETTIAQRLKALGYATGIVGKWHLGATTPEHLPRARGFDFAVGTKGNLGEGKGMPFFREDRLVKELPGAPITSPVFAREAVQFIERHRDRAWFLYVPFNAVHTPFVASEHVLARFPQLARRERAYAAAISEVDDAIGTIFKTLAELQLNERTLVFLIGDNGGASLMAEMGGLRGSKWTLWEGGIRVPWLVRWTGRIPPGRVLNDPVIQLDVLPTALAAAGAESAADDPLDGVNLLPPLEGRAEALPPRALFWRFGVQYAVREGDWKLVKAGRDLPPVLVNLKQDLGEQQDLTAEHPERAAALQARFDAWNATMQPPRWEDDRWNRVEQAKTAPRKKKKSRDS